MEAGSAAVAGGEEDPLCDVDPLLEGTSADASAVVLREHGRIAMSTLQRLQQTAREPAAPLHTSSPRVPHSLHCAACVRVLQTELAVSTSEVQCSQCSSEFAVVVKPDPAYWSKAAKAERRAERTGPPPPRAQHPFQVFMSTEVRCTLHCTLVTAFHTASYTTLHCCACTLALLHTWPVTQLLCCCRFNE